MSDERALAFLRELARADEEAAATLAELDDLAREVEAIRARAEGIGARQAALPTDRHRADEAVTDAERDLAERRAEAERAAAAVADAERGGEDDRVRAARHEAQRAGDRLRMVERRAERAREAQASLAAEADSVAGEAQELVNRARRVASALRERPALAAGAAELSNATLDALADWATQARAALFVARGRLATERDAVIRQANELAAAVLGEPLGPQSPAAAARRVEERRA